MKTLTFFLAMLVSFSLHAQIITANYFGGLDAESTPLMVPSGNFKFVGCGTYSDNGDFIGNAGMEDFGVIILDSNSNKIGSYCYGGPKDEHPFAMVANGSGGVVMAGYTTLLNGDYNVYIVNVDLDGDTIWTRNYGGSETDVGYGISKVSDGYLILAQTSIGGNSDAWIFKIDHDGNMIPGSSMTIGGSGIEFFRKALAVDDGYYLFGSSNSTDWDFQNCIHWGEIDGVVMKVNFAVDSILFIQTYGGPGQDYLVDVVEKENSYYIAGTTSSPTINGVSSGLHGNFDFLFLTIDSQGAVIESRCFGGSGQDNGYTIITAGTGFIMGGTTKSTDGDVSYNHGSFDCWIVKVDSTGNLIDEGSYGGDDYDEGTNVALIAESNKLFVAAYTASNNTGDVTGDHSSGDLWVFTVEDSLIATNVATVTNNEMLLYPNPTSDFIHFTNDKKEELFLITVEGKVVWSGSKFPIDMREFENGIYFLRSTEKFIAKIVKK